MGSFAVIDHNISLLCIYGIGSVGSLVNALSYNVVGLAILGRGILYRLVMVQWIIELLIVLSVATS